jgi:hypothetical protein
MWLFITFILVFVLVEGAPCTAGRVTKKAEKFGILLLLTLNSIIPKEEDKVRDFLHHVF